MPPIPRLRLSRFAPKGGSFHLARVTYPRGRVCAVHRHDFAEVFWLEHGRALHPVNGVKQTLGPGALVLIRPDDAHGFQALREGFVLVNVAFAPSVIDAMRDRYFDGDRRWIGAGDALPAMWQLPPAAVPQLAERVERLSMTRRGGKSRLDLDCFLLRLFQLLREVALETPGNAGTPGCVRAPPAWLSEALARFTPGPALSGGPADLAAVAGCSVDHLNRVVRHCYGGTTTDLLNHLRLERAAQRLRIRGEPIARVALDCGFENLGYFYRCFARRFRTTPRRYRLAGQLPGS